MAEETGIDLGEWLAAQRAASSMTATPIPLTQVHGWGMAAEAFCRPDGAFFGIVGVRVSVPKEGQREVPGWDQPMVKEDRGRGCVLLLKAAGEERYLVAAKAEPGYAVAGRVQLAPTLQASMSNLLAAHGGSRPPRAELLEGREPTAPIPQDGGRYWGKVNLYAVVEVDPATVAVAANERWCTRAELRAALRAGDVNEHLAQALLAAVL